MLLPFFQTNTSLLSPFSRFVLFSFLSVGDIFTQVQRGSRANSRAGSRVGSRSGSPGESDDGDDGSNVFGKLNIGAPVAASSLTSALSGMSGGSGNGGKGGGGGERRLSSAEVEDALLAKEVLDKKRTVVTSALLELSFPEFLEAIAAVCVELNPNPYVDYFIYVDWMCFVSPSRCIRVSLCICLSISFSFSPSLSL